MPTHDLPRLYRPQRKLLLMLSTGKRCLEIYSALERAIPEGISSKFRPHEPFLRIGEHDIMEWAEHDEGHLFGRAFFSLSLYSDGSPNDWQAYREAVWKVPEIIRLQNDIEAFAGPMERCVFWNV